MSSGGGGSDKSSERAAEAQLQATREALELEREVFNRQLQAQAPGRNIGNQALATLGGLYGFDPGIDIAPIQPFATESNLDLPEGAFVRDGMVEMPRPGSRYSDTIGRVEDFQIKTPQGSQQSGTSWKPPVTAGSGQSLLDLDPGYAFRLKEGEQALNRQASAAGGLFSGAQLKGAQRYGQEYASGEFSNAYNRLASLAGLQQVGTQGVTNALSNFGNTSTGLLQRAGDARASGYINAANAKPNRLGNALGGAATGATIGSVVPGIGTGIGAAIGAGAGLFL